MGPGFGEGNEGVGAGTGTRCQLMEDERGRTLRQDEELGGGRVRLSE